MSEAWFNCAAGVAGDMLLAALVDAGADPEAVASTIDGLGVDGWELTFERVRRSSVSSLLAVVVTDGGHDGADAETDDHHHRPVGEILELLDTASLPTRVASRARAVFEALATAEGDVHGIAPADVELHEVGSLDAIVDVVGVCSALEVLGVERVTASPIGVGHGSVATTHGRLPTPAPAVARLLAARQVPIQSVDTRLEIATPTGIAIMCALADDFGPPPPMVVEATGFGAGTADPPDRPNVVNVLVGTPVQDASGAVSPDGTTEQLIQIETNVDDVSGEVIAHTVAALLAGGAADAWAAPIVMKKGRPAYTLHVLASAGRAAGLADVLLRETGSLGVRTSAVTRTAAARDVIEVDVDGQPVRVKRTASRMKVEFDDAARAAEALGRPVREVLREAESLAHRA